MIPMGYVYAFMCGLHLGMGIFAAIEGLGFVAAFAAVNGLVMGVCAAQRIQLDRSRR